MLSRFPPACRTPAQKGDLQPHRFRYWLTEVPDPQREEKITEGCELYARAPQRTAQRERTISLDELTGVQALERKHPDLPMQQLLKRGNFCSLHDLRDQILAFIAYYNRTMAKPIKWTYTGLSPDRGAI